MSQAVQQELEFAAEGERRKQAGMQQAADNKASLLAHARRVARRIAESRPDRCVTMDDVQEALRAEGISDRALGNAAGSVLRTSGGWEWTGRRVKSCRPHSHRNELKVWRLVE